VPGLTSRGWVIVGVVVSVVVLAATWLLLIGPARSETATLRDSTSDVETQNSVLTAQNAALEAQASERSALGRRLAATLAGLPPNARIPVFSRQVAGQAERRGVELTGLSVGTPTVPGVDGAADATAASAPLLAIPVTLTATGSAQAQLLFLSDLQQIGPRLALVTSTALAPGQGATDSGSIEDSSSLTVQLSVFSHRLPQATRDQVASLLEDVER